MRRVMFVQTETHSFDENDPVLVIKFLIKFKRAFDSSRIHESAAIRLCRDVKTGTVPTVTGAGLSLPYNDEKMSRVTSTSYGKVINHLLWLYDSDVAIYKADDGIRNFKQCNWTPGIFQKDYGL